MTRKKIFTLVAAAALLASAGCKDYLTGGELSTDPNRVTVANAPLLFVGTQANIWSFLSSDPARIAELWSRQFAGSQRQYQSIYQYSVSEGTTNGFFSGLYSGGALVDLRNLQALATASNDSLMLGVAQTEEAIIFGEAAALFGDVVYSKALTMDNPPLDKQMDVYDAVQALLDKAIINLRAKGPTNAGPGGADLSYGGSAAKWRKLAFTAKARFYMHTAEVRPAAYAQALAATDSGITVPADDYKAVFSGAANEQNLWYQFDVVQRSGYIAPDPYFVTFLTTRNDPVTGVARNDPRVNIFFTADRKDINPTFIGVAGSGNAPTILVSAAENLLIAAEAAYRTGDQIKALAKLNQERTTYTFPTAMAPSGYSVAAYPVGTSGLPLLQAILDEKYIMGFMTLEPYNDYKRTCYPNFPIPANTAQTKVPARLFYDTSERNANTSIPTPTLQPVRNANDPANTTDPFGAACIGQ